MPPPRPPVAGGVQVLSKCFFQITLAVFDVDRVDVVGDAGSMAICFGPAAVLTLSDDQRRKQRVHLPRLVIELDLPEQLHVLDGVRARIFSSFCQSVRCGLPPSVSQSAPQPITQPSVTVTVASNRRIESLAIFLPDPLDVR